MQRQPPVSERRQRAFSHEKAFFAVAPLDKILLARKRPLPRFGKEHGKQRKQHRAAQKRARENVKDRFYLFRNLAKLRRQQHAKRGDKQQDARKRASETQNR